MFLPSSAVIEALGYTVLHSLWQAGLIAALFYLCTTLLDEQRARIKYAFANLALLGIVICSVLTFNYYYQNINSIEGQSLTVIDLTEGIPNVINISTQEHLGADFWLNYLHPYLPQIVLVWFFGVLLFSLRLVGGLLYLQFVKYNHLQPLAEKWQNITTRLAHQLNVNQRIAVFQSALLTAPQVIGYFKPIILFPIGAINILTTQQVEVIIAHELAHIRRHDFLFNILQSLVEVLYYFNPSVWLLSRTIRAEREKCCDDLALHICKAPLAYAKALLALQELHYQPNLLAVSALGQHKNQLLLRVQRILSPYSSSKTNAMEKCFLSVLIIIMLFLGSSVFTQGNAYTPEDGIVETTLLRDTVPDKDEEFFFPVPPPPPVPPVAPTSPMSPAAPMPPTPPMPPAPPMPIGVDVIEWEEDIQNLTDEQVEERENFMRAQEELREEYLEKQRALREEYNMEGVEIRTITRMERDKARADQSKNREEIRKEMNIHREEMREQHKGIREENRVRMKEQHEKMREMRVEHREKAQAELRKFGEQLLKDGLISDIEITTLNYPKISLLSMANANQMRCIKSI